MPVAHEACNPFPSYHRDPSRPQRGVQARFVHPVESAFEVKCNQGIHLVLVPRLVDRTGQDQQGFLSGPARAPAELAI